MKKILKFFNLLMVLAVLLTLIAAVGSAITKEPILLSVIRSNSMYPVWQRGDMVIIENMIEEEKILIGDIIFFKAEKGDLANKGWIAHRVIGGNEREGFITKGDNNDDPDQISSKDVSIQRNWIAGRAFTIGDHPIVIPKLGFLSLWLEKYQSNPYLLPSFAVILAVIVGVSELATGKKRKKQKKGMELQLIYVLTGLTITVILAATMITSSQKLNIVYGVSEESKGVIMGSAVGILNVGEEVTRPLTELKNGGIINLTATITTNDDQIHLSEKKVHLTPGQTMKTSFTVNAEKPGQYHSFIQVGLFYPLLPSSLIYYLANISYWLALVVVSLLPGLPFMLYPVFDGKMRHNMFLSMRKTKKRLLSKLPF